jgi:hypothetical protein
MHTVRTGSRPAAGPLGSLQLPSADLGVADGGQANSEERRASTGHSVDELGERRLRVEVWAVASDVDDDGKDQFIAASGIAP